MRLLHRVPASDEFHLVERFGGDIPPYAILSHTWGPNEDEVTYLQLQDGQAKSISGYSKLNFCSEQATKDKLEFFWVDTCCIDKSSSAELSGAINSMFKWYQGAEKCYVLLSDVGLDIPVGNISQQGWAQVFENSRWFQRGWTLQELLAPEVVEFFSKGGQLLGTKATLLQALHYRTQIPIPALQGSPSSQFSVDERISWMKNRQTKREEDAAYSLLGLLGIHMPLLYGEGREKAFMRLRRKAERRLKNGVFAKPLTSRPWTVPFQRNGDFINRQCLSEASLICCQPGGCATLLGPAGAGKTQLAIEYTYRVREQSPTRWVFWVNAATLASFEEGYRTIAGATAIPHRGNSGVDVIALVDRWLRDGSNGYWTMVLDNADHADVLFSHDKLRDHAPAGSISRLGVLAEFLPRVSNGSLLVTTRDQDVARRFRSMDNQNTTIKVGPTATNDIAPTLGNQIGTMAYRDEATQFLNVLHAMPLAITQATTLMSRTQGTDSNYTNASLRSVSSQILAGDQGKNTTHQITTPGLSHEDVGFDLANVVHRLTTAVEDLYKILPAVRAIQSEQNMLNTPSLKASSSHSIGRVTPHQHSSLDVNLAKSMSSELECARPGGMAVSIVVGTNGLLQLGLSTSDLAMLVDQGKKFGNFVRARQNDDDLFDDLGEDREAILKRRGLLDAREMEKSWPLIRMVHRGVKIQGSIVQSSQPDSVLRNAHRRMKRIRLDDSVDNFTWVMVVITSALGQCLPPSAVQELLICVFVEVLQRYDDDAPALRFTMKKSVESWRSFGCARGITLAIGKVMRNRLSNGTSDQVSGRAIPQLNEAEMEDTKQMLIWLLKGDTTIFNAMSPITFAIAGALKRVNLDLCIDGNPTHEQQACVTYDDGGQSLRNAKFSTNPIPRGQGSRPLQISWPRDAPESMIDALGVGRSLENVMDQAWQRGKAAADDMELIGQANEPYGANGEVYYALQQSDNANIQRRYDAHIGMLADQGLPVDTENIYSALVWILQGEPSGSSRWLHRHVAQDHLLRIDNVDAVPEETYKSVYFKYQAFVFGFYHQLVKQILSFSLVDATAFFHGIWGANSTTFLAMCTQLGRCWRRDEVVSRAHMLYVLSSMYNGRRKIFDTTSKLPRLVGVLGSISVLALPLVRTTDNPKEIAKIAIVNIPIVDLNTESADGDLMASEGGGIRFELANQDEPAVTMTQPPGTTQKWTVHACMSVTLGENGMNGVVMAARCNNRLVGWFNPIAADISFLSTAYVEESYCEEDVVGFEVKDEYWEAGKALLPNMSRPGSAMGVVRSHNSPSHRYAAAGFYAEQGEEIAIARSADEFSGAFERIEAQDRGMVIA